jgi:hypothetical protein
MNEEFRKGRADSRREREAEALRANLRKRKDQQRARYAPTGATLPDGMPPDETAAGGASSNPADQAPGVKSPGTKTAGP